MSASSLLEAPRVRQSLTVGQEHRRDIRALQALAVSLVLVYHLWPDLVSGDFTGVDVFFVISGLLITSHLLNHPSRSGRDPIGHWLRRVRRLLPAALTVRDCCTER